MAHATKDDCAYTTGNVLLPIVGNVQVAFQPADCVAWNLWSAINGHPLLPFKYQHLGDMMSLGQLRFTCKLVAYQSAHRILLSG